MKLLLTCLFFISTASGFAQQKENCRDVVYLRDGSIFRGKISDYQIGGDLLMTTWNGGQMRVPATNVKKIKQICFDENRASISQRPYSFRESGWYHVSRIETMWGANGSGPGLQHSSGLKINRLIGVGLGLGIENLTPADDDVSTYPLFAEARGYLSPKNIAPFYALGLGWAFAGKENDLNDGATEDWQGGWMAQAQLGYRIGNHFIVYTGLRFQRKTIEWTNWWGSTQGIDRKLQRRFEFGLGILL